jgi:DNA-binding NarL/FixJ family response regulator
VLLGVTVGLRPGLRVVGEAEDGERAIEQADRLQPDVILLDLSMPRRTGLDVPASFPSNQAAATSTPRAYGSSAEGNVVAPSAISENSPAKQTAVMRRKCIPNQAA